MVQKKYAEEVLAHFDIQDWYTINTPLNGNEKLKGSTPEEAEKLNAPYQSLVGSLMYLTRPDLAYTVSTLSQFNDKYDKTHWCAAKRVLRYLKGKPNYGLVYKQPGEGLSGFIDADWADCSENQRSYTGFAFIMTNAVVAICLTYELVENWNILYFLYFDLKYMLDLFIWFAWIFCVIMLINVPVAFILRLLFRVAIIFSKTITLIIEVISIWLILISRL